MTERVIEEISIGPQLTLTLHDCSRLLTGDRWQVILEARLEIDLSPDLWSGDQAPEPSREAMRELMGDTQSFVQRRERIFVSAEEREPLLREFIGGIKTDLVPYLQHPAFVKRFLEKQYREKKERSQWPDQS